MHNFTLPENAKVARRAQAGDGCGRAHRPLLQSGLRAQGVSRLHIDQGNAATIACDVLQATSAAGAGAKVLTGVRRIWTNLDLKRRTTPITRQTDALSFTTDAAVKEKLVIIEVAPSDLDLANGFTYIAPRTGASNVANANLDVTMPALAVMVQSIDVSTPEIETVVREAYITITVADLDENSATQTANYSALQRRRALLRFLSRFSANGNLAMRTRNGVIVRCITEIKPESVAAVKDDVFIGATTDVTFLVRETAP
jgi:hypothetical protein